MNASGRSSKNKNKTPVKSRKPVKSSAGSKAKSVIEQKVDNETIDPKAIDEHNKKIHAAAKEAQNAVKKALDNMADQMNYEEKYEE